MTDEEIRTALLDFSSVWRRVSGKSGNLPAGLVLMPQKEKKSSPYLR